LRDYADISFWLETAGDLTPRPPLPGSMDVDVAVLGAGYTGLWTAYYLLRRRPSLRVAILEAEIAGFGASGRNGAWCSPNLAVTHAELTRRYGKPTARAMVSAVRHAVDEVGRVVAEEGIDAQYRKKGLLRIARGRHELPAIRSSWEALAALDLTDGCAVLSVDELAERVRVAEAEGALLDSHCATVHPGRLVRGLARTVERHGGHIYEQTPVTSFEQGPRPRLKTARGDVRAETIVLAGEAYLSRIGSMHRRVLPIYSLIVLTEPLSDDRWERIGWRGHECVSSYRLTVDYLSRTVDGRILFGGRGAPYSFGSKITPGLDRHEATHNMLRKSFAEWFPSLRDTKFTHAWGGPLGVKRDWMPSATFDRASGVAAAYGFAGQGVAASNLAGRMLADQITGEDSEISRLPMAKHRSPDWEPEPLRWLGVRYVQRSMERLDERGRRTGKPPTGRTLGERLSRH
jgi:glycine/D-amino acid oxidase-like deaminating enzyme